MSPRWVAGFGGGALLALLAVGSAAQPAPGGVVLKARDEPLAAVLERLAQRERDKAEGRS